MDYIVLKNDSLWKIALELLKDGNLYQKIALDNNLQGDTIYPGLVLKLNIPSSNTSTLAYTVLSGDSLGKISLANGIPLQELIKLNNISNPNNILIGLKLLIPKSEKYVKKLRSTNEIAKIEAELNKKSDIDIINTYHSLKQTGEYYIIDDKKNNKLSVYRDGKLIKSYRAIHGKNVGSDSMTVTKTDASGKIINMAGNMSTPAGVYFTTPGALYHGAPSFTRRTEDMVNKGISAGIPSSIHKRTLLEGSNTNGCTGMDANDLKDLAKYITKQNTKTYILPADNRNKFFIRNGELQFKSHNILETPSFNTINKDPIQRIVYSNKDLTNTNKAIINSFSKSLISNKKLLQLDLGINNDSYNLLAKYALGILGVESGYGNENSVVGNFVRAVRKAVFSNNSSPDYKSKFYTYGINSDNNSIGLTLIRFSFLSEKEKKLFNKYGITKESLVNNPQKAAIATMIKLATEFKNGGANADIAVRRWNNKPTYLQQVLDNARRFSIYLKYLKGGLLTLEDRSNLWEVRDKFGADSSKEHYFNYWNFQPDGQEVNQWLNSYLQSSGLLRILNNQKNWWESRHPYRKWYSNYDLNTTKWLEMASKVNPKIFTFDGPAMGSVTYQFPGNNTRYALIGTSFEDYPRAFTMAHEIAHGKAPFNFFGTPAGFDSKSALQEALDMNKNTEKGHDSKSDEKHADNWGLKYLLYKEGIYDARKGKDITKKQVLELRKKYPDLRPFQQMNDDLIMFQINNVADNGSKSYDPNYLT